MRNTIITSTITLTISALLVGCATTPSKSTTNTPPATVANVNLDAYQGKWFEVARLPMYFQRHCVKAVTANYQKLPDGNIKVTNTCVDSTGKQIIANGIAVVDDRYPAANNSKLLVSFLPNYLQLLPFGKGSYWILALDGVDINQAGGDLGSDLVNDLDNEEQSEKVTTNYTHALVGSPNRKYLWLLSRKANISKNDFDRLIAIANRQGFDTSTLMLTIPPSD